jgi:hypothetical protein
MYERFRHSPQDFRCLFRFTPAEFDHLFSLVELDILASRSRRGRPAALSPKDSFLALLYHLAQYRTMAHDAVLFGVAQNTLLVTIERVLVAVARPLHRRFVVPMSKGEQVARGMEFEAFPEVALVVDCSVFRIQKPLHDGFASAKRFFSGKHGIYCVKHEFAHAPNGQVMFVSKTHPGAVHDFTVFLSMKDQYRSFLQKLPSEATIPDRVDAASWALMADKGYTGAQEHLRAVIPERSLGRREASQNDMISQDRIVAENFYGRMKSLFHVCAQVYRGGLEHVEATILVCAALTNYHMTICPLRVEDHGLHRALVAQWIEDLNGRLAASQEHGQLTGRGRRARIPRTPSTPSSRQ